MSKYKKMKQLIADMRLPEYRYKQLLDAVFLQGIMRFEDMKLLPKTLREKLVEQFGETVVEIKAIHHEKSMQTDKVLFELSDGNRVETVGLFYKEGWNSFCISSQSGCGFGCKFCATGTLGLRRNLTVDEITDQILYFMQQGCSINSISFMGMGEPFANPQVFEALHDLTAPELFGLSQRRITISTIGIVPGIQKLTREYPQVNLAYSLHAPTDRLRETLMPITKTYPLGQVLDTLDQHIRQTNRKVFLAYIMLKDVNDSDRHAEQLTKLLFKHKKYLPLYHLDLIPYNQTTVTETMVPSSHTRIKAFCRIIHNAGISVNIRTQFGSDINAACGQLAGAYRDDQKQGERTMSARDVKSFVAMFYKVNRKRIIREVYVPAIMPFIVSGISTAIGIGWRAIIVGEVLSQPKYGIGTDMHAAQLFLKVEVLIAWTVIAVLLSWLFEKLIRLGESKIVVWRERK